jgi:hypothetical protein
MAIASRTPEGSPNRCPVCGNEVKLDPSKPTLDAPCPHCGHLLWFASDQKNTRQELVRCVLMIVTARFGPPSAAFREAIEAIAESERLETMLEQTVTASRLEELLVDP